LENNKKLFKVVRKEILDSDISSKQFYLLTVDYVFTKNMKNKIFEQNNILKSESYIYVLSKYNLSLGQIYESTFELVDLFQNEKYKEEIGFESIPRNVKYAFFSKPRKYYKTNDLLKFSDVSYKFSLETFSKPSYKKDKAKEVRVYNVKQGNMNTIHYDDEVILYDWGTDVPGLLPGSPRNLKTSDVTTIILSHHHFDHYSIFVNEIFSRLKTLVIPDGTLYFSLFLFYIKHRGVNLLVVPLSTPGTIRHVAKYGDLDIFIGPQMGLKSNKNNECIIINIDMGNNIKSLTGDILWYLYVQSLRLYANNKNIDFVVPHHGGYIGKSTPKLPFDFNQSIYSFGVPNRHGHPSSYTTTMVSVYTINRKDTDSIIVYNYYIL